MESTIIERNSLHGRQGQSTSERLYLSVADDCARFSLRVSPEDRPAAGQAFGCALPAVIGGIATRGDRMALCLGPDEWRLMAPLAAAAGIATAFIAEPTLHSLVDVSHRDVGVTLNGPAARFALNTVCALDLAAMPSPFATRTILEKAQAILIKYSDEHFRLEVWQSFAPHLWDLFNVVRREVASQL